MRASMTACSICGSGLAGRQRKYCSRFCKNKDTNHHHQSYRAQRARGSARKVQLIAELGGRCTRCGYDRNLAALTWHHVDRAQKSFELDMRSLSNRSESDVRKDLAKCILRCATCPAEEHFPQFAVPAVTRKKRRAPKLGAR
jgi:hypothetical protein